VTLGQLRLFAEPSRKLIHLDRCPFDARAACEVRPERLGGIGIALLREVAHSEISGQAAHRAGVGLFEPAEDAQEGRLPCAVRSDEADATARRHDERDVAQDELRCVVLRDVGCGESAARALQERTSSEGGRKKGVCLA